jgi:hypothetical protein
MLNVGEILLRFAHDQLDNFLCDRYRIIDMSFTSMNPTDETTNSSSSHFLAKYVMSSYVSY